jgi:hypothetical protein
MGGFFMSLDMNLLFNGQQGMDPEYGSPEHNFLLACTFEQPELWAEFDDMDDSEVEAIVDNLVRLGWGFEFVTLH